MKILLLHNPEAGQDAPPAGEIADAFREQGCQPICRAVDENPVPAGLLESVEAMAIAGGDGTFRRVCRGLNPETTAPIILLPTGTANNVATSLGLTGSWRDIAAGFRDLPLRNFDVADVRTDAGGDRLFEGAGFGLFAEYMNLIDHCRDDSPSHPDAVQAHVPSLLDLLRELPAREGKITTPERTVAGRFLMACILNTSHLGPNLRLCPAANPGDGRLDIVLVPESHRSALREFLKLTLAGEPPDALPFDHWSSSSVTLTLHGPGRIHLDDHTLELPRHEATLDTPHGAGSRSMDLSLRSRPFRLHAP